MNPPLRLLVWATPLLHERKSEAGYVAGGV